MVLDAIRVRSCMKIECDTDHVAFTACVARKTAVKLVGGSYARSVKVILW